MQRQVKQTSLTACAYSLRLGLLAKVVFCLWILVRNTSWDLVSMLQLTVSHVVRRIAALT